MLLYLIEIHCELLRGRRTFSLNFICLLAVEGNDETWHVHQVLFVVRADLVLMDVQINAFPLHKSFRCSYCWKRGYILLAD